MDTNGQIFAENEKRQGRETGGVCVGKAGRPPKYKNAEELQEKIDKYFADCEPKPLMINGHVATDKKGAPIITSKPLTITGLALALGFNSRQSLLNYEGKKEFLDTITRAKARVEQYTEERLFDKDGAAGARFSLANNFSGWADKVEVKGQLDNNPYAGLTTEELKKLIKDD